MPRITERQQHTNALLEAYIIHIIAEAEARSLQDSFSDTDSDGSDWDSNSDLDSESSSSSSSEGSDGISDAILATLMELHHTRYQQPRRDIPKVHENLKTLLGSYKQDFPDIFRSYVRLTPQCFDDLVTAIQGHPVFHNDSNNPQAPVEEQVAIALFWFGHYGNAASTMKVALWAGISYGSVRDVTIRVMTAICDDRFRYASMPWSNPAEIERAKAWVEENSCPAWRDGWLMVDGTLVPIYQRPHHFGNSYFDQKSNYSLNVQVRQIYQYYHID